MINTSNKTQKPTQVILLANKHPLAIINLAISQNQFNGMVPILKTEILQETPNQLSIEDLQEKKATLFVFHGMGPSTIRENYPLIDKTIRSYPSPKRIIFVYWNYTKEDYSCKTDDMALIYRQRCNCYFISGNPYSPFLVEMYDHIHGTKLPLSSFANFMREKISLKKYDHLLTALKNPDDIECLYSILQSILQNGENPHAKRIIPEIQLK